jgi:hypothetical protein
MHKWVMHKYINNLTKWTVMWLSEYRITEQEITEPRDSYVKYLDSEQFSSTTSMFCIFIQEAYFDS